MDQKSILECIRDKHHTESIFHRPKLPNMLTLHESTCVHRLVVVYLLWSSKNVGNGPKINLRVYKGQTPYTAENRFFLIRKHFPQTKNSKYAYFTREHMCASFGCRIPLVELEKRRQWTKNQSKGVQGANIIHSRKSIFLDKKAFSTDQNFQICLLYTRAHVCIVWSSYTSCGARKTWAMHQKSILECTRGKHHT